MLRSAAATELPKNASIRMRCSGIALPVDLARALAGGGSARPTWRQALGASGRGGRAQPDTRTLFAVRR